MGTDIHGVFQRRNKATGHWVDVATTYEENRDYQLFAVLAGVRNGVGFAGVKTGDPVIPVSGKRGLPADFAMNDNEAHPVDSLELMGRHAKYHEEGEPLVRWMGDHSHSWLTGAEMLAWAEHAPIVRQCGVIRKEEFEKWDHKSRPEDYSGDVCGGGVRVIEQPEAEAGAKGYTHVRVYWHNPLRQDLAYFFDEVARLQAEHGEIRFVFGFDS